MRRRAAFTLVEMMVSVALVLFIMVILTEAFGKGLESFRTLKAIGDMESRLRAATAVLRRDLEADHFEGKRRLSEDTFTWKLNGAPREGVFTVMLKPVPGAGNHPPEGGDADGIAFRRSANWLLHMTAKARGNNRSEFYTAVVPAPTSPTTPSLVGAAALRTTFFDQPSDARFQDQQANGTSAVYSSQWAEIAFFLEPSGQTPGDGVSPPTALHTLYRSQYVMIADNSKVNWPPQISAVQILGRPNYDEMSCVMVPPSGPVGSAMLRFFTPGEAAAARPPNAADPLSGPTGIGQGAFLWGNRLRAANPILTDVVSLDVSLLVVQNGNLVEVSPIWAGSLDRSQPIHAIKITLRVYEPKTKQTRQTTLVQDL